MTVRERARRAARIVAARHSGITWRQIAAEFDISVSQAKAIVADWQDSGPRSEDSAPLEDLLAGLTVAIEQLATVGIASSRESNRIGALKAYAEALILRYQIEVAVGRASHPRAHGFWLEADAMFREFADILGRHGLSDDVIGEMLELARSRSHHLAALPALTTGGEP